MNRGEIWWADLGPGRKTRPVVLLTRQDAIAARGLVTIAAVTSRRRHVPAEVPVGPDEGLPRESVVNLDLIDTIPRAALHQRVGPLSAEKLRQIDRAIHFALGLRD